MSSAEKEIGRSMVRSVKTWSKSAAKISFTTIIGLVVQHTVLHNITNDAKLVEVTSPSFCSEWFFKGDLGSMRIGLSIWFGHDVGAYLNVVDVIAIPCSPKKFVTESKNEDVLHHLFAQVMIDSEKFLFFPVRS